MWDDLFAAAALVLVFEGMIPFVNPARWRAFIHALTAQPDNIIRIMGLASMLAGAGLLYVIR